MQITEEKHEFKTQKKIIGDMADLDPIVKQDSLEGLNQAALFLTMHGNLQKKIKAQKSLIAQAPQRIADLKKKETSKKPSLESLQKKLRSMPPTELEKTKQLEYSKLNSETAKIKNLIPSLGA